MGWIKRNLFIVIGGVVTLGLLGAGGFYIYQGLSRNSDAAAKLEQIYQQLNSIHQQKPAPGNEKVDNTQIARDQDQQLRDWIAGAGKYFQPIAPIPAGELTSKTYATALGSTIYQLQQEAKDNSVSLPPQYNFSFQAQSSKLTISSGLEPLAAQLGEVKAIAEILFAARVNALDGIQRVRVSADDAAGSQADYIDMLPVTNDLAVITPYIVTFRCFTPEISRVVGAFASGANTFLIKSINIQPATTAVAGAVSADMPGAMPGRFGGEFGGGPPPAPPIQPMAGKGGLQTVLKEQLLRVSLEVGLVKLLPKS